MNLNEIAIFVKIVELGSFIAASKSLEIPKSTVSSKLSSLEKRLGLSLIVRTTRKLHVTDAGKKYYQKCLEAMSLINDAEIQMSESLSNPYGKLKITAPVEFGNSFLPEVLFKFNQTYPNVHVEVELSDRYVDIIKEGFDLAFRVGNLQDSTLRAKKIGHVYFAPFIGKKLAKKMSELKHPSDLNTSNIISFNNLYTKDITLINIKNSKEKFDLKINNNFSSNDLNLTKQMTIQNVGVSFLPTFLCLDEVNNGQLIRILKNWSTEKRPVQIVYPEQKFQSKNLIAFNDLAFKILKKELDKCDI